jgi:hypothetical protein
MHGHAVFLDAQVAHVQRGQPVQPLMPACHRHPSASPGPSLGFWSPSGPGVSGKCEADTRLGYQLLKRVTAVMYQRLERRGCGYSPSTGPNLAHARVMTIETAGGSHRPMSCTAQIADVSASNLRR